MDHTITFTAEELIALCARYDLPVFPGLAASDVIGLTIEQRQAVLATALRSLAARGLLGDPLSEEARGTLRAIALAAQPALRAVVMRVDRTAISAAHFAALPGAAVEHRWDADDLHTFDPFPSEELFLRLLSFTRLSDCSAAEAGHLEVSAGAIFDALLEIGEGNIPGAATRLAESSQDLLVATRFAEALAHQIATVDVAVIYAPEQDAVRSSDIAWLDAGELGLWERSSVSGADVGNLGHEEAMLRSREAVVAVRSVSPADLRDQLFQAFP